jgi:cytidyltransferase-like protein
MINIFCDGIFDLFHMGHLKHLEKIYKYFDKEIYLIVGLINDSLSISYKRKPIFTEKQREKILLSCIYVNKVIIMDNLIITEDFLNLHSIDYVLHAFANKNDIDKQLSFYEVPKKLNKFIAIDYNTGISTTSIINTDFLEWSDIWEKKGLVNIEDLYLLNGWEKTKFNPEEFIKHIKIILKISDIDKIIEIGCGSGLLSLHFNKDNYIGIDKSLSLINKNIKILKNTVLNFSSTDKLFKNDYFDYCICNSMLEYLNNLEELNDTIDNMERITKNGIYIGSIGFNTREKKEDKHKFNGVYKHFIIPKKYFIDRNYTIIDNKYCDERYDAYKFII